MRYGFSATIINTFTSSIQKAYNYTKDLDTSLNNIRIVTGKSAEEMDKFAIRANQVAKDLGKSTKDFTNAALIYYQQGMGNEEAQARAEVTLKTANVTGQSAQEVSEMLTAVWNGYKVNADEAELYIDKLAAVASTTASDLEELSTGMSKVASAANTMGVDIDQLNAQLATIVSVTRQAPELVGTALRTIYARMGDIQSGLSDETTLGNYTEKMASLGVHVLDANGKLRDMGKVIEEIGNKWNTMSKEQQVALSQTMAGTRQYNNLLALFNNWDMYTSALQTSADAMGTLQRQQDIYMESTEAHLQKLATEAEKTYSILFDQDLIKGFADSLQGTLSLLNSYFKGLGGGLSTVVSLGTQATNLFSTQISESIARQINNKNIQAETEQDEIFKKQIAETMGYDVEKYSDDEAKKAAVEKQLGLFRDILEVKKVLSDEEFQEISNNIKKIGLLEEQINKQNNMKKNLDDIDQKYTESLNKIEQYDKILLEIEEQGWNNPSQNLLNEVDEVLDKIGLSSKEKNKTLNNEIKLREQILQAIQEEELKQDQLDKEAEQYSEYNEDTAEEMQRQSNELTNSIQKIKELKEQQQNISTIVKGISTTSYLITSSFGMLKTAFDDSMTPMEKMGAIASVLASQAITLIANYESLGRLLPSIAIQLGIIKNEEAVINAFKKQGIVLSLSQIALKAKEIALEKLKAAWVAITAALQGNFVTLAIAAGVAVAAVGVALAVWVNNLIEANSEENKLNEKIEKTKTEIEKATTAYNELKDTISNYQDAKKGIDELTEGTTEFYDAILKSNTEAQKLIDKFDLIVGKDYTVDKNGLININQDILTERRFREQQELFRKNANLNQLQLRQEEINQDKIIEQFAKESGFSNKESAAILKNINSDLEKVEPALNNVTQTGKDVTKAFSSTWAKYEESQNKQEALRQQESANLIRGYGSKELVDKYNSLTIAQQQSINKYVANQQKANQKNIQATDAGFWGNVGYNLLNTGIATLMGPVGLAAWVGGTVQNERNKDLVKQEYAKNVLGYQNQNDVWTDRYGKTVKYKDIVKEIDVNAAREAYNSGEYTTASSAQAMLQVIKEAKEKAYQQGMNEVSQNYVAEAYAAIKSGNLDYDIAKMLTNEEKDVVSQLIEGQALGIDSDKVQQWLQTNNDISRTAERLAADAQAYKAALSEQAKALETSTEALDLYAYAMRRAGKVTDETTEATAKAAAQSYGFNKAYNKAADSFKDNEEAYSKYINALKNGQEVSYDVVDAVAELQKELEKMTGLSFTPELLEKEFPNIKTMLTGTADEAEKAYNRIQAAAIENTLVDSLGYNIEQAANFVSYLSTLDPGAELNETWSQSLAQMVNNAHMTREQVENLFATMHIALPEMEEIEAKEQTFTTAATSTKHRYKGQIPTGKVNFFTGQAEYADVDYEWTETTEPVQQKYVTFNDQKINFKRDNSTKGSFGRAGSGNFTKKLNSGKSGGGSKNKEPNKVDKIEDEADRYHDINAQLNLITNNLNKAEKEKEKLFGKDLIKKTNKEITLLNERIEVTKEKIEELKEERAELQVKLGKQGLAFDAEGYMINYAEAFAYQLGIVNKAINDYNSMTAEEQEKAKKDLEEAQRVWKEFKDDMSRYDTIQNSELYKAEEEKQKDLDEILSKQIENFNYKIEIRLDMAQAERDWNKFQREIIKGIKNTDILKYTESRLLDFSSYYKQDGTGAIQKTTQQLQDILIDLQKMDEGSEGIHYGNDRKKALSDLEKYFNTLTSNLEDVQKLQEEIHEQYINMQDEAQEKFDEQIHTYELIGDLIDHDMKLIQLVYGEKSYSALDSYYRKQEENNNNQLDFYRQEVEFWKKQMDAAEKGSKAWENAKDKWEDSVKNLNSTIEKSIENLQNKYLNTVNQIFKDLNDKVTGGLGLDYINEEWTLINKNAEQYLDTINSLFGIQQLENKYLDAIDRTDSVGAQKQLKELMDAELADLRERDKLTQYDVDRANKKYEIALKQIALQEAQQNKTKMRLRRDSQGNYRYEYTTDNEQINQIQDELNGLYNSLYNFDKARYQENLNQIYSVWSEFQQKMAEAAQINDPQERAERELLLKEEYGKLINGLVEQNEDVRYNLQESAFQDLAILYNKNVNDYKTMTDTEKDLLMNDLIPQWDKGVQHMADIFAGEGGFIPVCKKAFDELDGVTKEYQKSIHTLEEKAGTDLEKVKEGINNIYGETDQLLQKNDKLIGKYGEEMTRIGEVMGELRKLTTEYNNARVAAEKATEAAYNYRMEQNRIAADSTDETTVPAAVTTQTVQKAVAKTIEDAIVKNSESASLSSGKSNGIRETTNITNPLSSQNNVSNKNIESAEAYGPVQLVRAPVLNSSGDNMLVYNWNMNKAGTLVPKTDLILELSKLKKKVPGLSWSSFASGGYTGTWGNDGRLAFLHQKELVLNAHDTENMLNAVTIMRDITSTLGGSILNRLAGIAAAGTNGTTSNGILDQNVNIQATFPNVTNSHEIEDALNNLVNMAAIRANRKGS